jgi:DNA polymerase III delta prime subunit
MTRVEKLYAELHQNFSRDASKKELWALAEAMEHAEGGSRRYVEEVMELADELLGTHGVEYVAGGEGYEDLMLNAGDIYNATIIFNERDERFEVTTEGDFREGREAYRENPLKHGFSRAAISENIAREIRAGRDREQAVAIAYQTARTAWKERYPHKPLPAHLRR